MTPFELQDTLSSLICCIDTREQNTVSLRKRMREINLPTKRIKLDFGDYSCEAKMPDGKIISFGNAFVIERKMNLDELAMCFTSQRSRFSAEFERAKEAGAKIYLLVENATTEKILNGQYRSQISPNAFMASLYAFMARYNCSVVFCKSENSGRVIKEVLYREAKERLKEM